MPDPSTPVPTPSPAQNPAEELVFERCKELFFPLWSYLNPLRHDGSELCDVLVAFGDDILVISVKRVEFNPDGENPEVGSRRWHSRAVERSMEQARGARRYLAGRERFEFRALNLPTPAVIDHLGSKRIHCIAVALGSGGWIPISFDDDNRQPGKFVHVLTEESLGTLTAELSTMSDLVHYLTEKERFFQRSTGDLVMQSELDLLGMYIRNQRTFPTFDPAQVVVLNDFWEHLIAEPAFQERLRLDNVSVLWDLTIHDLIRHQDGNIYAAGQGPQDLEPPLRVMASEDRFQRRVLAKSLHEILVSGNVRARMAMSTSGQLYVFMVAQRCEERQHAMAELFARCHAALLVNRANLRTLRVVGIATQPLDGQPLRSHDLVYVEYLGWSTELEQRCQYVRTEFGYFANPVYQERHELEYPQADPPSR